LDVRVVLVGAGVGDEHHRVDRLEDVLAARVALEAAGEAPHLPARPEALHRPRRLGEVVEAPRELGLAVGARDLRQLAPAPAGRDRVEARDVGVATSTLRPEVDDLRGDLPGCEVDRRHRSGPAAAEYSRCRLPGTLPWRGRAPADPLVRGPGVRCPD